MELRRSKRFRSDTRHICYILTHRQSVVGAARFRGDLT